MFLLYNLLLSSLLLILLLLVLASIVGKKAVYLAEKSSPFECGFNPKLIYRSYFSLQFFLVALLFLIFDLELVILFPFVVELVYINNQLGGFIGVLFIGVLFLGLVYE